MRKFIKTYEELSPELLGRAKDGFDKLGHKNRAREISIHRIKTLSKGLSEEYGKFGNIHVNNAQLNNAGFNDPEKNRYNFFLEFVDDLEYMSEPPSRGWDFKLEFRLYIIPTDEMVTTIYNSNLMERFHRDLEHGYIYMGDLVLSYRVNFDEFNFEHIIHYENDYGSFNFVDRKSSLNVLRVLRNFFNQENYPGAVDRTDQTKFFKETIDDLDFLSDYGIEFEEFKKEFFKFTVNRMYKD